MYFMNHITDRIFTFNNKKHYFSSYYFYYGNRIYYKPFGVEDYMDERGNLVQD